MIVVADTGPVDYLILIDHVDVLQKLYQRVLLPTEVVNELRNRSAPPSVRAWASRLPAWCEVVPVHDEQMQSISHLDAGERAAIQLALQAKVATILIDELEGRQAATRLGLMVRGTLGLLKAASLAGELDLQSAVDRLLQTNFAVSETVLKQILLLD